ncbi:hypothetical protein Baya_8908 [Bagarius yarrelli]|uniref:Uncharacterized protein n=1 Tax=Bagarius yarrelli TaxID=175774 RepID=A0A556U8B0_BAGYA|nr:hypothetical protein Baya_8908 [Bagarius yarrelli]
MVVKCLALRLIVPVCSPNHAREACEMKLEERRTHKHVHTFKEVLVIEVGNLRGLAPHLLLPRLGSGPQDKQRPLILITALIFSPARSYYHNSRSAQYLAVVRFKTLAVILRESKQEKPNEEGKEWARELDLSVEGSDSIRTVT